MGSSSPNWKQLDDYAFTDSLTPEGWCWEFMRRNPEYRRDYADAQSDFSPIYNPPMLEGESLSAYLTRISKDGVEPVRIRRMTFYANKWHMTPNLSDPYGDDLPIFQLPYPLFADWEDIGGLFHPDANDNSDEQNLAIAPQVQEPRFPTLTFDLTLPLKAQVGQALALLKELKWEGKIPKKSNLMLSKFVRYIRLLDALEMHTKTKDIVNGIEDYQNLGTTVASEYQAQDTVSDNKKAAMLLMNNPLQLLS